MKHSLFILFNLLSTSILLAQNVGINTTLPRKTLEVAGNMNVTQNTTVTVVEDLQDQDEASFLIQNDANSIITLDPKNPTGPALGYIQVYVIENPDEDWVFDFDTGISATDFTVIITSAHFNKQLALEDGDVDKFSLPYYSSFIKDGTWHLFADYPGISNTFDLNDAVWRVQTLIFSRDLDKEFGTITVPMGSNTTGAATNPFID